MGVTFKENVSDIRNSRVPDIILELKSYGVEPHLVDPHALSSEVEKEYGIALERQPEAKYDAIVVAVGHDEYKHLTEEWFTSFLSEDGILVDIKGLYRNKVKSLNYWSL